MDGNDFFYALLELTCTLRYPHLTPYTPLACPLTSWGPGGGAFSSVPILTTNDNESESEISTDYGQAVLCMLPDRRMGNGGWNGAGVRGGGV